MAIPVLIAGSAIASWAATFVASLGISFISVQVLQYVLEQAYLTFQEYLLEFPILALQLLGLMNADLALNLIFTAYIWRMSVSVFLAKRL